jgi:hypothetical protein
MTNQQKNSLLQAAHSNTKAKASKRVFFPKPRDEIQFFSQRLKEKIKTRHHTGDTDRNENETVIGQV